MMDYDSMFVVGAIAPIVLEDCSGTIIDLRILGISSRPRSAKDTTHRGKKFKV